MIFFELFLFPHSSEYVTLEAHQCLRSVGSKWAHGKRPAVLLGKTLSFCQEHCLFCSWAVISQTPRYPPTFGPYGQLIEVRPERVQSLWHKHHPLQTCFCTAFCCASKFVVLWFSEINAVVVYRRLYGHLSVRWLCAGMCASLSFFFFPAYLLCFLLTAGSISHVERGDGENRHPTYQGQRKPH